MDANLSPIVCFGENGNAEEAIRALEEILEGTQNIDFIIFAYEPLKVAEQESIDGIRDQVKQIYEYLFDGYGVKPSLVYGGGIARKDIHELMETPELSGIMIGKVSAKIEQVEKIMKGI